MLIADIKGKLSLSELISEDFLTSSVFSAFNYLNPQWLEKFLCLAENRDKKRLNISINNPQYIFWPWFNNAKKYGGGAEPDVLIYSEDKAILIEAKNFAGKSGEGIATSYTDMDTSVIVDQLGREYFIGTEKLLHTTKAYKHGQYKIKEFYLIYLTRHNFFPISLKDQPEIWFGLVDIII